MINGPGKHSVKSRASEVTMAAAGVASTPTKTFRPEESPVRKPNANVIVA